MKIDRRKWCVRQRHGVLEIAVSLHWTRWGAYRHMHHMIHAAQPVHGRGPALMVDRALPIDRIELHGR